MTRAIAVLLTLLATGCAGEAPGPLGRSLADLSLERWVGDEVPLVRSGADGPTATLIRWWTDDCPFCEQSLPAFEALRRELAERGLEVVAVFHPKPRRAVSDEEVVAAATERGYTGTLAIDEDWSRLEQAWPEPREVTSVTLLLDADGVVRYAHPGPELHPANDGAEPLAGHEPCAEAFAEMRRATRELLGLGR